MQAQDTAIKCRICNNVLLKLLGLGCDSVLTIVITDDHNIFDHASTNYVYLGIKHMVNHTSAVYVLINERHLIINLTQYC